MEEIGQHRWLPNLWELDQRQQEAINDRLDGSSLLYGPAGSGKTAIIVYRAKTLLDRGNSVKVFVFTNVLAGFIRSAAKDLGLPADLVEPYYTWVSDAHRARIGPPPGGGDDKFMRWTDALIAHFRVNPDQKPHYDYILVDEAQDLPSNAARLMRMLSRNVFVVGDTSQSIYQDLEDWRDFPKWWEPLNRGLELLHNYRNPRSVAQVAAIFLNSAPVTQKRFLEIAEGREHDEKPIWYEVDSSDEQANTVVKIVDDARGMQRIGILFRHKNELERMAGCLQKRKVRYQIALKGTGFDFNRPLPALTTLHSAKGIEFDCVIIPDLNAPIWDANTNDPKERRLFFVALTRTKSRLCLISQKGRACSFLREIPPDLLQRPSSSPNRPQAGHTFNSSLSPVDLDADAPF